MYGVQEAARDRIVRWFCSAGPGSFRERVAQVTGASIGLGAGARHRGGFVLDVCAKRRPGFIVQGRQGGGMSLASVDASEVCCAFEIYLACYCPTEGSFCDDCVWFVVGVDQDEEFEGVAVCAVGALELSCCTEGCSCASGA